ncbi:MAG: gamma-glutamyl-gamma-aminobutyrate hydrolase family protein [Muribaculaceae bacterium]
MKSMPLVGISDNYGEEGWHNLKVEYVAALAAAGALPVIVPFTLDSEALASTLSRLDAVVLSGGGDLAPETFGGEFSPYAHKPNLPRDRFDIMLYRLAVAQHLPVLGICRGLQVINVAEGGDIYQDLAHEIDVSMTRHSQTAPKWQGVHGITFTPNTATARLLPQLNFQCNSFHHQAIKRLGNNLLATAVSDDGIIEGIEHTQADVIAVQYHPERMALPGTHQLQFLKNWVDHLNYEQLSDNKEKI